MHTLKLSALLPLLLLVACDTDGDGLSNSEEKELGTDPELADSDADGLDDLAETELGTDPLVADSDGDGLSDSIEVDGGSDPLDRSSWPEGTFPDFSYLATSLEGTGWAEDDIMPDFEGFDQFGNDFHLYQYYGSVVILDLSAGWCGPCQDVASGAEALYQQHRDKGFTFVHSMSQDWDGEEADQAFLAEWADEFGLSFPVIHEPEGTVSSGLRESGLSEGYIPFMVVLDKDMRIDSAYTGGGTELIAVGRAVSLLEE